MKKSMYGLTVFAVVASLFLTAACVLASDTDTRIESSAKQSYVFKNYLKDDDIKVLSKDGTVTLTGTVANESHKSLAAETVAGLPGVKSVQNKLEVKGKASAPMSDAWLTTKVKSTLLFHRNVNATKTEVSAENGTVTVRGVADSTAQKELTTEYIKDVEGVKIVKNEMTVSPAAMKPGETKLGEKMDAMTDSIDDASITAMVKATLLYHRSTSALNTTVETKDGVVMLGGKAKSAAEKDLATKLVSDVYGVRKVVNNMAVQ